MAAGSIEEYLAGASPDAAALIARLRAMVRELEPGAVQSRLAALRSAKDTVRLPLDHALDEDLTRQLLVFLLQRPARS